MIPQIPEAFRSESVREFGFEPAYRVQGENYYLNPFDVSYLVNGKLVSFDEIMNTLYLIKGDFANESRKRWLAERGLLHYNFVSMFDDKEGEASYGKYRKDVVSNKKRGGRRIQRAKKAAAIHRMMGNTSLPEGKRVNLYVGDKFRERVEEKGLHAGEARRLLVRKLRRRMHEIRSSQIRRQEREHPESEAALHLPMDELRRYTDHDLEAFKLKHGIAKASTMASAMAIRNRLRRWRVINDFGPKYSLERLDKLTPADPRPQTIQKVCTSLVLSLAKKADPTLKYRMPAGLSVALDHRYPNGWIVGVSQDKKLLELLAHYFNDEFNKHTRNALLELYNSTYGKKYRQVFLDHDKHRLNDLIPGWQRAISEEHALAHDRKNQSRSHRKSAKISRAQATASRILLVIAGVEQNPGPNSGDNAAVKAARRKARNQARAVKHRAAIAQSTQETNSQLSGANDALRDKLHELKNEVATKDAELATIKDAAAKEVAVLTATVKKARDLGYIDPDDDDPVIVYAFHGRYKPNMECTFDSADPLITVNVMGDGAWWTDAFGEFMRLDITREQIVVAASTVSCTNPCRRFTNIYNGLVQASTIKKSLADMDRDDALEFAMTMDKRAFLLCGTVTGAGRARWQNDVPELVPHFYTVEAPAGVDERLHNQVVWAPNCLTFEASHWRKFRAAPFRLEGLTPYVPDAADQKTMKAALDKRLFPRLPVRSQQTLSELRSIADDLGNLISQNAPVSHFINLLPVGYYNIGDDDSDDEGEDSEGGDFDMEPLFADLGSDVFEDQEMPTTTTTTTTITIDLRPNFDGTSDVESVSSDAMSFSHSSESGVQPSVPKMANHPAGCKPSDYHAWRMEVLRKALEGRPKREKDGIEEGFVMCIDDPHGAIEYYCKQPYKCFIKLEAYPKGSLKPPRFIMSLDLKCRGIQIFFMGTILARIEHGTRECNVKGLTEEQKTLKLIRKFHDGLVGETDFSSFESCIGPDLKNVSENNIFHRLASTPAEHMFINNALGRQEVRVHGPSFVLPHFHHIRMSGDYWTSLGNLVENVVLLSYCLNQPVTQTVREGLFEGDDGVFPAPERPELVIMRSVSAGVKLTFDIAPWKSLSFCGNHFEEVDGAPLRFRDKHKALANLCVLYNAPGYTRAHDVMLQRSKALAYLSGPVIPDAFVFAAVIERFSRLHKVDPDKLRNMGLLKEYSCHGLEGCVPHWLVRDALGDQLSDDDFCYVVYVKNHAAGGECDLNTVRAMVGAAREAHPFDPYVTLPCPAAQEGDMSWQARDGSVYTHVESRLGFKFLVFNDLWSEPATLIAQRRWYAPSYEPAPPKYEEPWVRKNRSLGVRYPSNFWWWVVLSVLFFGFVAGIYSVRPINYAILKVKELIPEPEVVVDLHTPWPGSNECPITFPRFTSRDECESFDLSHFGIDTYGDKIDWCAQYSGRDRPRRPLWTHLRRACRIFASELSAWYDTWTIGIRFQGFVNDYSQFWGFQADTVYPVARFALLLGLAALKLACVLVCGYFSIFGSTARRCLVAIIALLACIHCFYVLPYLYARGLTWWGQLGRFIVHLFSF